jgi:hypothetical protein
LHQIPKAFEIRESVKSIIAMKALKSRRATIYRRPEESTSLKNRPRSIDASVLLKYISNSIHDVFKAAVSKFGSLFINPVHPQLQTHLFAE